MSTHEYENLKRQLRNKARYIKPLSSWTDGKGIITRTADSHENITEERLPEFQARKHIDLSPLPLFERPNHYEGKKRCAICEQWKALCVFTGHPKPKDGKHPYCNTCRMGMKRLGLKPQEYRRYLHDLPIA